MPRTQIKSNGFIDTEYDDRKDLLDRALEWWDDIGRDEWASENGDYDEDRLTDEQIVEYYQSFITTR